MFDLSYYFYSRQNLVRKLFPDLASYFNSYERVSPARLEHIAKTENAEPGYTPEELAKHPSLTRVTADNYPKLHQALLEECAFRKIPEPACYIDASGEVTLGSSRADLYSIFVSPTAYAVYEPKKLRALVAHEIKHLYQKPARIAFESELNEYDCDASSLESTDYETVQSYVHHGATVALVTKITNQPLRNMLSQIHFRFPQIAQYFPFSYDNFHGSPGSRMKALRDRDAECPQIQNTPDLT